MHPLPSIVIVTKLSMMFLEVLRTVDIYFVSKNNETLYLLQAIYEIDNSIALFQKKLRKLVAEVVKSLSYN